MSLTKYLLKLADKNDLTADETRTAFDIIFEGKARTDHIPSFLLGLKHKGETADELLGAAQSMRSRMVTIKAPENAMDIVGTGGDAHSTLNISTAVAFVVAACGIPVAKHGNRAASSRSGSSDVLAALGINLDASPETLERCLAEANLCFMFAPRHHPAMQQVAEIRAQLKTRTIFNLLGPLTNPANVKQHLIGVYSHDWLEPMAQVLNKLSSKIAWLTHGQDGMDEITTTAPTDVVELRNNRLDRFIIEPEHVHLKRARLDALKGGEAAHNAAELKRLLQGQHGTYRDIVLFNASAALVIAGKAEDLNKAMPIATQAIDRSAVLSVLDKLLTLTNK
jgi:anthranilate phosphoribosyltransferase